MYPPLPLDTCLQDRYCLRKVLGQGGFGRTYLAEDRGRFNEWCVLKEFAPSPEQALSLGKSRELFAREAATLYQLQHPQIPQFRATLDEDSPQGVRFFLVQDYVEGPTYHQLLNERRLQGQTFTQAEVVKFLADLLPVLAHIHQKGIIHRDISLENLICRRGDGLPVLIDFGGVKTLITSLQGTGLAGRTVVGKVGYSPPEQMQTGRVYPSSDLYALAVCAVVLLTARDSAALLDEHTATWRWQQGATVDPRLAQVLNQMLAHRVSDRFPSADAVIQALFAQTPPSASAATPITNARTIAVAGSASSNPGPQRPATPPPVSPRGARPPAPTAPAGIPWGLILGLIVSMGVAAIAAWAAIQYWVVGQWPEGDGTASPPPTPLSTPAQPTVETSPSPSPLAPQELDLAADQVLQLRGSILPEQPISYVFAGNEGDRFIAELQQPGIQLKLTDARGNVLAESPSAPRRLDTQLPRSGLYTLQLELLPSLPSSSYELKLLRQRPVVVPTPAPTPVPPNSPLLESPVPPPSPEASPDGATPPISRIIEGELDAKDSRSITLAARAKQTLTMEVLAGDVLIRIRTADGQFLPAEDGVRAAQVRLPETGDYTLEVYALRATSFQVQVQLQ